LHQEVEYQLAQQKLQQQQAQYQQQLLQQQADIARRRMALQFLMNMNRPTCNAARASYIQPIRCSALLQQHEQQQHPVHHTIHRQPGIHELLLKPKVMQETITSEF
jgi:hypothetical protein